MRLVLDTNVIVAAFVARGTCADLLEHCVRTHVIVSCESLLDELRDVLVRKMRQSESDARAAVRLLTETFTLITPAPLDAPVCRDPDDDVVLATASHGACAAIVTGDKDLLTLEEFKGIKILAPADFWKWETQEAQAAEGL